MKKEVYSILKKMATAHTKEDLKPIMQDVLNASHNGELEFEEENLLMDLVMNFMCNYFRDGMENR